MPKKIFLCLLLAFSVSPLPAQVQTGIYPYGSFDNLGVDSIDRGSLNVHFSIPVVNKQGRGLPFQYELVYDSLVWTPVSSTGAQVWTPAVGFGLHGQLYEGFEGYLSYFTDNIKCYESGGGFTYTPVNSNYVYHDPFGVSHPLPYTINYCTEGVTGSGKPSVDGSGYSYNGVSVVSKDGKQINAPANSQTAGGNITDTNGNYISNNGNGTFTDTLGTTGLTITGSGTASSPRVFTYSTPTGTANVTVTYKTYTVRTNFGCASTEFNMSEDLPYRITLGDGTFYEFAYEATPGYSGDVTGRLYQLTLPQGGVITYTYSGANNGIICADGTPAGLTRSGGVSRSYARPASLVTSATSHTDITDGLSPANVSNFDFVMSGSPESFYETNRTVNQGSSSVLLTRQTCYANTTHPCTTTAVALPIAQIDTYESLNGSGLHGSRLTYNFASDVMAAA